MAASASPANARTSRLSAFLHSVIKGKRAVTKARDATLLIEAICDQPDHTACVEKLVASDAASDSLRAGLRFDISDAFINNELQNLLAYLSDPLVKHLCNGDFLRRLLLLVVDPPSLWHAVVEAFKGNRLSPKTEQSFAWLLLELLSWNSNAPLNLQSVAQHAVASERFTKSDNGDLRSLGYRIKHVLHTKSVGATPASSGPGGRHDNDFTDFRQIAIYPTEHELVSKERPFYRRADAVDEAPPDQRAGIHLDNQFRLLREDMLAELREDLKISQSKKGRRKNLRLRGLSLAGFHCGAEKRRQAFSITVRCTSGLERLTEVPLSKRKSFLNEDKKFLKHQSFGCLMNNDQVVAFATLERVQDNLLRDPPIVTLRIPDTRALERALLTLKVSNKVDFVLINTAMFAYEPILECLQAKVELPLAEELLSLSEEAGTRCRSSRICPDDVADRIAEAGGQGLDDILSLPKPVNLDESQTKSLLSGLRQTVSLIQGPPGTGKSFIGALLAKALHDHTSHKILVICYTNHALDQFLEDLLDVNIPDSSMVRLGAQSRPRTEHLSLFEQSSNYRRTQATWDVIRKLNDEVSSSEANLKTLVASYVNFQLRKTEIMEYLEFSDDYSSFFDAFQLPEQADGFAIAGKDGSAVDETYLYDRWRKGEDPGVFKDRNASEVWELSPDQRKALNEEWIQHLLEERVASISSLVEAFDASQKQLQTTLDQQKLEVLRNKRIIACTTTAAAKYTQQLRNASPDIILVEEAGEILESHVLTAMTPETKQLILIGDHQQLRPKVNNYDLTVEKGNGYDLNRSLFERLILAGFPHTTLAQQHRMCPEISALVRHLTYPKLLDAPSTQNKPSLRGMQDRVVFFNHHYPEFSEDAIADRRDQGSGVSKKNHFEAEMVLQIVRYMAQQGYGTSDQVVLTPYLGQLSLLRRRLSEENDPVLNDLDSFDLVKAGLLSPATAKQNKRQIKISTIDNYQGEESDIVIVSLTRGNTAGDIGFMSSPERLNVLLSRARIGLIIIGNSQTFQQSRKGKATWGPFMDYLSKKGHIYEGLPVKCQQHPGKKMILKQKTDFDEHCPDAQEWKDQKQFDGASNSALDDLMGMIGLENVKDQFLSIKGKIDVAIRQGLDMKNERFGAALLGNPGTGKTTVARLYAKFLASVGALPGNFFVETTGSRLANDGVSGCKKHIEEIMNNGGGAMFIDEAYQLVSGSSAGGSQVLDFLLAEVENRTGKIVFILAGYNKQMEAFFAHNPGIPSRFPREMQFKDYEDEELLEILKYGLVKRYGGRMKVELGVDGLYARIVARRIGRGRGRDGFGNARAVENALAGITDRQAKRLRRERKSGIVADDLLLTQEDLLGPEPADVLKDNASWNKLQQLIGLSSVKDSVKALFDSIQYNYSRELDEEPLVDFTLNKVFLGNPGTGKTTVAKLYGQILADIGLLSSGEVVVKTPADFVGSVIGASEANTKGILAATVGKVLVIDEAYGLYGGNTGGAVDPYKTAVIDTIVAEVQSVPGDDRCVLLLGYKEQMEEMFQNVNPGLTRRFPLDSAFTFEDFSDAELAAIFDLKLKQQGFAATDQAKKAASDMLSRARNRPHFGNAGEIDIILNAAKLKHQQRISKGKQTASASFEPQDFDPDFDRGQKATTNVAKLFEGVVGCDDIVSQLKGYQTTAANMRELGLDPKEQIPFAFLFRGPPGTGKTSTARRMGKVYYDMGFLATAEVLECSVSELVGEYVGQTGPKTQKLFEKALGKVLFIDEAYRLAEGHFAKEAMDEIVDCITKPRFAGRLVVILAGYDEDINRLMAVNPGLTSRFPETVSFRALRPEECLDLFAQTLLAKRKKGVDAAAILDPPPPQLREKLVGLFARLAALPNWASARDVGTLAKNVFGRVMRTGGPPTRAARLVSESCVVEEMERMVREREHRGLPLLQAAGPATMGPVPRAAGRDAPRYSTSTDTAQESAPPPPEEDAKDEKAAGTEARDSGVSDAVWEQLQQDKAKAEAEEREHRLLEERAAELEKEKEKEEQEAREREQAAKDGPDDGDSDDEREKAERERRRLEKIAAQRKRDEERAKIERKRKEELAKIERKREERRVEAKKQECLRKIGICPMGFRWIKQADGYRCEAGGHWVSNQEIERYMQ
ncbi:NFX1-type zinc finger-containing protein 1 [Lasiodiplodia hormozganensis]|uniref:NFX1-type zinc finger-containing protein 1 n=1 Tax=Lasiodiplodia hormozganensis TaxID=869390 RepID=A0AA39YE37_9PEZI|nr:NFX1-type zinc finger-containing protein 1 [Lasiodiplodia hormozganensis]